LNKYRCSLFLQLYPGTEAVDFYLAKALTEALGSIGNKLLFFSIVATNSVLRDGHSCLKLNDWAGRCHWRSTLLNNKEGAASENSNESGYVFPDTESWINALSCCGLDAQAGQPLVFENERLYLRRYWQFETELANHILVRQGARHQLNIPKAKEVLDILFPPIEGLDWQKIATANALGSDFSIIAGGPGTGKTTTVTKLLLALLMLADHPLRIKMAAPTGKAAQRLAESIRGAKLRLLQDARVDPEKIAQIPEATHTLHRLLGVQANSYRFQYCEENRLELDMVLVDEVSMVDLPLMTRLFRALPDHARVVMLGDADQLPSVAAGSVMADLVPVKYQYSHSVNKQLAALTSETIPILPDVKTVDYLTRLVKSYRFRTEGGIGNLARQVIKGQAAASWNQLQAGNEELTLVNSDLLTPWLRQQVVPYFDSLFTEQDPRAAFRLLDQFRVLTATRVGECGAISINQQVEDYFRDKGKIRTQSGFYHGRPLMVTANYYEWNLFNGDVGLLWHHEGRLRAVFLGSEGELRWFLPSQLPAFETVFAMTIHKTQGSEFARIALVIPDQISRIVTRELLYTGITRAKKHLTVWSSESSWKQGVKEKVTRASGLRDRLG